MSIREKAKDEVKYLGISTGDEDIAPNILEKFLTDKGIEQIWGFNYYMEAKVRQEFRTFLDAMPGYCFKDED